MRSSHIFWSCALAVGITAHALPSFAGEGVKTESFPATAPSPSVGTDSPSLPGSGSMHETDRTGTTGPSGSSTFSPKGGAIDVTGRVAKPAGDYAVTTVDRSLAANIRAMLMGNPDLVGVTEDSLHIKVNNGEVTLEGQTPNAQVKDTITAKVRDIPGVKSVRNDMQVLAQQHHHP